MRLTPETLEFIRAQLRPERFAMSVIDPVGRGESA